MAGSSACAEAAAVAIDPAGGTVMMDAEDGAAASPTTDGCGIAGAVKAHDILGNIKILKEQQLALKEQRRVVAKMLKNEEKRRSRLKKRARQLSDNDLLAVLKMRDDMTKENSAAAASSTAA